jgi:hypothetical protein
MEKDTVDFVPNYDETREEPTVLPAAWPNLLVNGGTGIAVGMATNIPPHNLAEVIDAVNHLMLHPEATPDDLMEFVKGPDFPTGGLILGRAGIEQAYTTGRGSVVMRARATIEPIGKGDREMIVVTEIPYQVNKATLIEKIAELVRDKRIAGIREESRRRCRFDQLTHQEEARARCHPLRLLHVVRHEHDRHGWGETHQGVLDPTRGHRIECRTGFVQQQHRWTERERPCDAETLLLSAGQPGRHQVEAVRHLLPELRGPQRALHHLREHCHVADARHARRVRHVLEDRARQWLRRRCRCR